MSKKTFVIGVQIEVEASTLEEAYGKVYETMNSIKPTVEWESTDTNWCDDGDKGFYTKDEISEARSNYVAKRADSGYIGPLPTGVTL